MSHDQDTAKILESTINDALNEILETIPTHTQYAIDNKQELQLQNTQEFVYGLAVGMGLTMSGAILSTQLQRMPTPKEQEQIREIVFKRIPKIRAKIFNVSNKNNTDNNNTTANP